MKDASFPSASQTFFVLLALLLVEYVFGAALYDFRHALHLSRSELDVFVTLFANATIFTVLMHAKGMTYANLFHATRASLQATAGLLLPPILLLIPALVLAATTLTDILVQLVPLSRWEEHTFARMAADNLPSIVATCLLAPILEEMLFRGIILRSFLNQYSRSTAILWSALFFGLAHLNIYQFVVAFMLGTVAGWLYERSRSLIPCIALHGFYNSSLVALEMTAAGSTQLQLKTSVASWLLALIAAALGSFVLKQLLRSNREGSPARSTTP